MLCGVCFSTHSQNVSLNPSSPMIIGYARVSTDRREQDSSINSQVIALREAGARHIIRDRNSAYSRKKTRKGWQEVRAMVAGGGVTEVLIVSLSRGSRQSETREMIEFCESHGAKLRTLDGTNTDISSPEGLILVSVLDAVNETDSMIKSRRVKQGIAARKKQGYSACGKVPYGYRYNGERPEPNPETWEIAKQMITAMQANEYRTKSVIQVNEIPGGKFWTSQGLLRWLKNPMLRGHVYGNLNHVQPLITEAEYAKAMQLLQSRKKNNKQTRTKIVRLFSELVTCTGCGGVLCFAEKKPYAPRLKCYTTTCTYYGKGFAIDKARGQVLDAIEANAEKWASELQGPSETSFDPVPIQNKIQNLELIDDGTNPHIKAAIEAERKKLLNPPTRGRDVPWAAVLPLVKLGALRGLSDEKLRVILLDIRPQIFYMGNPAQIIVTHE